jgi:DNA-binding GntR family transcriptional regulator
MRPLQALSRRFWLVHVRDEKREIETGSALHRRILEAIADRDVEKAVAASQGLNDYLIEFATEIITRRSGQGGLAAASPPA